MIKVLGHTESYKWFGCMLRACLGQDSEMEYHIHQTAKFFQKHRGCKEWSIKHRVRYFEAIVSSTACFAPTFIQTTFTKNMTLNFESFIRHIVGHPRGHELGQRDGMTSGTSGICVWITGARASEILSWSQEVYEVNTRFLRLTLQIHPAERWVGRAR